MKTLSCVELCQSLDDGKCLLGILKWLNDFLYEQWARTSHMMVYFIRWIHRAIHISPSNWDDQSLRATNFMQSPDNSFITTKIAADSSQNNRNEAPHRPSVHNTRETSNTMGNFIRNSYTLLKYHSIALLASAVHQNICCCVVFFFLSFDRIVFLSAHFHCSMWLGCQC